MVDSSALRGRPLLGQVAPESRSFGRKRPRVRFRGLEVMVHRRENGALWRRYGEDAIGRLSTAGEVALNPKCRR